MLEQLKNLALQQLANKMGANSLGAQETSAAAEQGSNALLNILKSQIGGGKLDQITDLFSNNGNASESNGIFQELQGKMQEILQAQGMNADEAVAEAQSTTPDLIDSIKAKFESSDSQDQAFDLNNIAGLLGGDAGNLLNKVKNFL